MLENRFRFDEAHKDLAFEKLPTLRAEIIFEFADFLNIADRIDLSLIKQLVEKHIENLNYSDAAILITSFDLHASYPCEFLLDGLGDKNL